LIIRERKCASSADGNGVQGLHCIVAES
jgi:hypothetical protein